MKQLYIMFLATLISGTVLAQEYYLRPHTFALKEKEDLNVELYRGSKFDIGEDRKVENSRLKSAKIYRGAKPENLIDSAGAVKSSLMVPYKSSGLHLVAAELFNSVEQKSRTSLNNQFAEEGFADVADKAGMKQLFSVNNHYSLKTLVISDKASGSAYEVKTDGDFEIVLSQNPYKMKYGEDITVQVLSKGEPVKKAYVAVTTKTLNGSLFASSQVTDDEGKAYVKLNRAGEWLIKAVNILPAEKSADFDRWFSSYSFSFLNK
ncbi:DUF4198 domain-containing protein [Arcticibacter sp.]|uniref:DUF4198 domain-containing protein n=1 Tax=Arcticibacter sp. TaxID=1872630 RepID=UPI003890068A